MEGRFGNVVGCDLGKSLVVGVDVECGEEGIGAVIRADRAIVAARDSKASTWER